MITEWEMEVFFVGAPRNDGTAPDINKAVEERFFLVEEDARKNCDQWSKAIGYDYGVFKATVVIPREKPIYRSGTAPRDEC